MDTTPWFPRGYGLTEKLFVGKLLSAGDDWQLYETSGQGFFLAITDDLYKKWLPFEIIPNTALSSIALSDSTFYCIWDKHDMMISSVKHGPFPCNVAEVQAFTRALHRSRTVVLDIPLSDGLYFERYAAVLPTYSSDAPLDDKIVLGRWISGGVEISIDSFDRFCEITSWLSPRLIEEILLESQYLSSQGAALALEKKLQEKKAEQLRALSNMSHGAHSPSDRFSLPGRPELEKFFNEYVVEIVLNEDQYRRMGIDFPGAIVLHGAPGCGKTYAVEQLIQFLDWPNFYISSGSIGSPYIHDTSKKISEMFDDAIQNAPSVLVIDEMEAFLPSRASSGVSGQHHVEEVAEFLRRIPEATKKHVLVIAMTNLLNTIDPAILRRGRFDHIIEVKMPSAEEVLALLHHLLKDLPISADVDFEYLSKALAGHPLSDVTYSIKEAGRMAVRANSNVITNAMLVDAIQALPDAAGSARKIGF